MLRNNQVIDFLGDFESKSTVELLEGASKEKSDLIASAKKRGILAEGSRDLGLIKTIYLFTDRFNDNGMMVSSAEFQKKFPQIVGKPMNANHVRTIVVGVYIDYKYILKENKAIAYAIFFKSIYPALWKKIKLFKSRGKLSSSFEIWSPEKKRKTFADGTEELRQIEIAGGALIFEEKGQLPAFRDAKVLAIAKKEQLAECISEECLVLASKYKDKEIIVAGQNYFKDSVEQNYQKLQEEQNRVPVIKCSNCEKDFESLEKINIKCPNCFAIVNTEGKMIYPPQIKNFRTMCPACNVDNWLIISNEEESAKLKCQSCTKEYQVKFAKEKKSEMLDKMTFLYIGYVTCPQCSRSISVEGTSKMETVPITCSRCKLRFNFNRAKMDKYKQISEIDEIVEEPEKDEKSSKEGGEEEMKIPKEIEKKVKDEEKKNEELKEKPSSEEKVEPKSEKIEEVKPEKSQAEPEKAQKENVEEIKVEKIEEPKAEETKEEKTEPAKATEKEEPVAEEIKEENKVEEKIEVAKETKEEPIVAEAKAEEKVETAEEKTSEVKAEDKTETEETPKVETTESKESLVEVTVEKPEEAQKTKQQQRGKVVFPYESPKVKDKKDHFPINDANQARNALARVAQYSSVPTWYDGTLAEVQSKVRNAVAKAYPSIKVTKSTKALRRAVTKIKELKKSLNETKEKKETLVSAVKETASQVISLKEEITKITKESEEKIKLYKESAQTVVLRKAELGEEYSKELSDEDILNEDKFERAKLEKENDLLKGSKDNETVVVGEKPKAQDEEIDAQAKEISDKAFGRKKRNA